MRRVLFVMLSLLSVSSYGYTFSAWVPAWDGNALTSMQLHAGSLDESNPGWYSLDANGAIAKNWNAESPQMRAAMTGTRVLPTIANYLNGSFDPQVVLSLIATPEAREAHAEALRQLVVENAFDGIDIDYELLPAAAKADFSAFVALLAGKLHAVNKKLSVTLAAKANDSQTWPGPGGNDWSAIGASADSIKIMAYDKHYPGGVAGAITPLDWLDIVVAYAEAHIPSKKVIVGLPWYGYDWAGTSASAVTYAGGMQLAVSRGVTPIRDANGELTFAYEGHEVFFQDAQSYATKVNAVVAKHPGIGGFAHWRAGAEDDDVWHNVESLRSRSRIRSSRH